MRTARTTCTHCVRAGFTRYSHRVVAWRCLDVPCCPPLVGILIYGDIPVYDPSGHPPQINTHTPNHPTHVGTVGCVRRESFQIRSRCTVNTRLRMACGTKLKPYSKVEEGSDKFGEGAAMEGEEKVTTINSVLRDIYLDMLGLSHGERVTSRLMVPNPTPRRTTASLMTLTDTYVL